MRDGDIIQAAREEVYAEAVRRDRERLENVQKRMQSIRLYKPVREMNVVEMRLVQLADGHLTDWGSLVEEVAKTLANQEIQIPEAEADLIWIRALRPSVRDRYRDRAEEILRLINGTRKNPATGDDLIEEW